MHFENLSLLTWMKWHKFGQGVYGEGVFVFCFVFFFLLFLVSFPSWHLFQKGSWEQFSMTCSRYNLGRRVHARPWKPRSKKEPGASARPRRLDWLLKVSGLRGHSELGGNFTVSTCQQINNQINLCCWWQHAHFYFFKYSEASIDHFFLDNLILTKQ